MLEAVGTALTGVIGWVGQVIDALTTEAGALKELLPLFAIGVGVSALMVGIRAIKSFIWGA